MRVVLTACRTKCSEVYYHSLRLVLTACRTKCSEAYNHSLRLVLTAFVPNAPRYTIMVCDWCGLLVVPNAPKYTIPVRPTTTAELP